MDLQIYNADYLNEHFKDGYSRLPEVAELKPGQIHVWKVSFNLPENLVVILKSLLSDGETNKVNRLRTPCLKKQYIVFHATLKKILGRYLGLNESEITITMGAYGKPAVSPEINSSNIQFSMSKSLDTGVYAFMVDNEIGIDIEKMNPLPDMVNIVKRHFSEEEIDIFEGLQNSEKINWFYTVWTRKEALLKAIGCGFYMPLEQVDVSHVENIKIHSDMFSKDLFSLNLTDFTVLPEFKSAICTVQDLS